MILTLTYYKKNEDKNVFLQSNNELIYLKRILNHLIWKKADFWKSAIFESMQ